MANKVADKSDHDKLWNEYIDHHSREPSNPQQLLNFSKRKRTSSIGFSNARKAYARNKGRGKIGGGAFQSSAKQTPTLNEEKEEAKPKINAKKVRPMKARRMTRDTSGMSLEEKYQELLERTAKYKKENKELREERDELNKKVESLTTTVEKEKAKTNTKEKREAWDEIYDCLIADPDRIKTIMKSKIIDINEKDYSGQTLLMLSADYGWVELAQFCINMGADINIKDDQGRTALDWSRKAGYFAIQELLLFEELNASVGDSLKVTSEEMHRQNSIIENMLNELTQIGEQSKELFEKSIMELMIMIIKKRLLFSDTILNLCWQIACRNGADPLKSELWNEMKTQCNEIIQIGNKRDWYWLQKVLIPSTIWYQIVDKPEDEAKEALERATFIKDDEEDENKIPVTKHYLYFELLRLADEESVSQTKILEKDLKVIADKNIDDWNKMVKWELPKTYEHVRQDVVPNGIVSQYTYSQLSESSGATFNSPKFYDYNQYLCQLVLLAQIVDDDFHVSVQKMFDIDKVTSEGVITFDEEGSGSYESKTGDTNSSSKTGDGYIKYLRGPVKLIDRARAKAMNDYADEDYPASACVLDLNRCCFLFNDISTLLRAVELFVNKVKFYQSGSIIGIVRDKNGFIEWVRDGPQYSDIKLNVLIRGQFNNIIGEVQFLLDVMQHFKHKAHNLYAIQRKREAIEGGVTKVLPILMNKHIKLFGIGIGGNVNALCRLMVFNNMELHKELLKKDPKSEKTILHLMASKDRVKAITWIKTMMTTNRFVEYLFQRCEYNVNPIEFAMMYGAGAISKIILDIPQVKEKYMNDDETLYGLLYHLFGYNKNDPLIDYIFQHLEISPEKFCRICRMKIDDGRTAFGCDNDHGDGYSKYQYEYGSETIMNHSIDVNRTKRLEKWISIIGEKQFSDIIFIRNAGNVNGIEKTIIKKDLNMMRFLLNIKDIKQRFCGNEGKDVLNKEEITHILKKLNQHYVVDMAKIILTRLNLDENKLKQLKQYKDFDISRLLKALWD